MSKASELIGLLNEWGKGKKVPAGTSTAGKRASAIAANIKSGKGKDTYEPDPEKLANDSKKFKKWKKSLPAKEQGKKKED